MTAAGAAELETELGRYRVHGRLGEGGFADVLLAEQLSPVQRNVALKILKPGMDSKAILKRFATERQALAAMDHPGIARVLDAGMTGRGRAFLAMEYIPGIPITDFAAEEHLTLEMRVRLVADVCRAVHHAHGKGVIHRDLKPTNILVRQADGPPVAKVIDFGVAKVMIPDLAAATIITHPGQLVGTLEYMSPEQLRSSPQIDARSDVYSLGVVLYELITGDRPFDAEVLRSKGYEDYRHLVERSTPVPPSTKIRSGSRPGAVDDTDAVTRQFRINTKALSRRVSGDLDRVVLKCLQKERDRRYADAGELADDLERFLAHKPVAAARSSRLSRAVRQQPARVVAAIVCVVVMLVAALWLTRPVVENDDPRPVPPPTVQDAVANTPPAPAATVMPVKPAPAEPVRAPAAAPDHAIVLFDGSSWDQWVTRDGRASDWRMLDDGSVEVGATDAVSRRVFTDFAAHLEFLVPEAAGDTGQARGNSGVYLHGLYEIQILDSYGEPPTDEGCGAVWSVVPPLVNASTPAGTWQSYDIDFRAPRFDRLGTLEALPRVSVRHNGIVIHADLKLPAPTPGGLADRIAPSGPLMLQHHGAPVRFRNIRVTPRADAPTGELASGPRLWVAASGSNRILSFDPGTGAFEGVVAEFGPEAVNIRGLAIGPDGLAYVSSKGIHKILRFDPAASETSPVVVLDGEHDGLHQPSAIVFGPDGNLYVASQGFRSHAVLQVDVSGPRGVVTSTFHDPDRLQGPAGLAFSPDGALLVTGFDSRNVIRLEVRETGFGQASELVAASQPAIDRPLGIAVSESGRIFISDYDGAEIHEFAADGRHVQALGGMGLVGPADLALVDDMLLATDLDADRVFRFDVSGGAGGDTGTATPIEHGMMDRPSFLLRVEPIPASVPIAGGAAPRRDLAAGPVDWAAIDGGNGHAYRFVRRPGITWTNATHQAEAMMHQGRRGHLATIGSLPESRFVAALLGDPDVRLAWLGGYQPFARSAAVEPAGGWAWITGEPWEFAAWGAREPDDDGPNGAHRLAMAGGADSPGSWSDARSDVPEIITGFVVEFDEHAPQEQSIAALPGVILAEEFDGAVRQPLATHRRMNPQREFAVVDGSTVLRMRNTRGLPNGGYTGQRFDGVILGGEFAIESRVYTYQQRRPVTDVAFELALASGGRKLGAGMSSGASGTQRQARYLDSFAGPDAPPAFAPLDFADESWYRLRFVSTDDALAALWMDDSGRVLSQHEFDRTAGEAAGDLALWFGQVLHDRDGMNTTDIGIDYIYAAASESILDDLVRRRGLAPPGPSAPGARGPTRTARRPRPNRQQQRLQTLIDDARRIVAEIHVAKAVAVAFNPDGKQWYRDASGRMTPDGRAQWRSSCIGAINAWKTVIRHVSALERMADEIRELGGSWNHGLDLNLERATAQGQFYVLMVRFDNMSPDGIH